MKKPAYHNATKRHVTAICCRECSRDIKFYRASDKPYGAFSNLFRRPFVFEEREFPTAEHAYQAGKPRRDAVRDWILSAPSPSLVAMASHGLYVWDVVPNWADIKFKRMREVLRAKFSQHQDLQQLLIDTGEARLVEAGRTNNAMNRTWGEVNGKGLNMLGVLLMELRTEFQKESLISGATGKKHSVVALPASDTPVVHRTPRKKARAATA